MTIATAADWKTTPMPAERRAFALRRLLEPHEVAHLRRGLIPRQMEDKWFVYWTDDAPGRAHLTFHRSWTGTCIFIVAVSLSPDGRGQLKGAEANGVLEQYRGSDATDPALVDQLITGLLSRR